MALYVVIGPNAPYARGTKLEEEEDLPGMVRPVEFVKDDGQWVPVWTGGIILPLASFRDQVMQLRRNGLDKQW